MHSISNFAKSGFWDYKNIIVPAAVTIPLALEGAILAKKIYQRPGLVKENLLSFKNKVIQSFTIQKGEDRKAEIKRIAKNSLLLLSCLSLMGAAIACSVIFLPGSLAITAAISSVFLIGKIFANYKTYKKQLIEAFQAKIGEDPEVTKKRIFKNKLKALALVIAGIATIAIASYIIIPMLNTGFTFAVHLPFQTKGVVFAEYALVGALHGVLTYKAWKKGDKKQALFHLFAAALSFIFPLHYLNNDMRLHHSFYGLLMMALPSRPLRFLGSIITFDSLLYMIEPWRGYTTVVPLSSPKNHQYDFINSIVDNYALFAGGYAGAGILQNINDSLKEEEKKKNQIMSLDYMKTRLKVLNV
jgi:hypothetical protein